MMDQTKVDADKREAANEEACHHRHTLNDNRSTPVRMPCPNVTANMKKGLSFLLAFAALCICGSCSSAFVVPRQKAVVRSSSTSSTLQYGSGSNSIIRWASAQLPHCCLQDKSDDEKIAAVETPPPTLSRDVASAAASRKMPQPFASSAAALAVILGLIPIVALTIMPDAALAASTGGAPNTAVLPNALVAYGHYFFLLVITILLTFERVTVKAGMPPDTEKSLVIADASYGVTAALLFVTGYLRATEYGKGWDFYAHEPLFWLKLSSASLLAGLSLFPTITFVKRGSKIFKNEAVPPMSVKLAARMQSILNAELSAILTIPLLATLAARGVSNTESFPGQAGAACTALTLVGSSVLYVKQALTWTDDDEDNTNKNSIESEQ